MSCLQHTGCNVSPSVSGWIVKVELSDEFCCFFEDACHQYIRILGKREAYGWCGRQRLDGYEDFEVIVRGVEGNPDASEPGGLRGAAFVSELDDELVEQRTDPVTGNRRSDQWNLRCMSTRGF